MHIQLTADGERRRPHLEAKRDALLVRRKRLIEAFSSATEKRKTRRMATIYKDLFQTNEFLKSLDLIDTEAKPSPEPSTRNRYRIGSFFIHRCFRDLTVDQDEQLFFVTGLEIDGWRVLDQAVEFSHTKRSMVGVTGNLAATHRLLIKLEQFEHKLLAHFHSHPGIGAEATHPSGVDEQFQTRLESAGYPTVAAIFSRDGYVRFFRMDNQFEVLVHGSGVEHVGNHTFRLTNLDKA